MPLPSKNSVVYRLSTVEPQAVQKHQNRANTRIKTGRTQGIAPTESGAIWRARQAAPLQCGRMNEGGDSRPSWADED